MSKLDASIYELPEVARACERAQARHDADTEGTDYAVYVDPNCPSRTFFTESDDPIAGKVCVFDTADGGRLL